MTEHHIIYFLRCFFSRSGRQELWLVLQTQLAEYKQHRLLHLGFIFSLAIATSTLLCILVLNHASKQQYQQANTQLTSPVGFYIVAEQGARVTKSDFSDLRRQGFTQVTPVLTFRKHLKNGKRLKFVAIDMLALSIANPAQYNHQAVLLTQAHLVSLTADSGINSDVNTVLTLADNTTIPIALTTSEEWGKVALLDIGLAWQLFPQQTGFSALMVAPLTAQQKQELETALPAHLSLNEPWSYQERSGFADALHLNLMALASLGFVVSMFIAFQAGEQAWYKRAELAMQLRLLGVTLQTIKMAMLLEALCLVLVASVFGMLIAVALVTVLLPLLGLTFSQLYALNMSGHFVWQWQYVLWALVISLVAVLLALVKQFKRISTAHVAQLENVLIARFPRLLTLGIAVGLLLLFSWWPSHSWHQIMVKYGLLLIASVALLPHFLQGMLFLGEHFFNLFRFNSFWVSYIFKDASNQVERRYLPLAAFYLALTTSIAAALMVHSFEGAFVRFLDQQLSADLLIRYHHGQKQQVENWLQNNSNIDEYILRQHTWAKRGNDSIKVSNFHSSRQLASLLLKSSSIKTKSGCFINEQLALKRQLTVDQSIIFSQGKKQYSCVIQGIYYEYGYPGFSLVLDSPQANQFFSGWIYSGFGVYFNPDTVIDKQAVSLTLGLAEDQIYDPAQVKKSALAVFAQTFVLTQLISVILLVIACFGLFLSATGLELARKADLYILCSLGYSKAELFAHMLMQWLLLAVSCVLLSWPVATILAHALVSQALPASFGWSMPLLFNVGSFAVSSMLGLLFLLPALGIPLFKLNLRSRR
ncbi:MAG: FtsX-like permease family protein [Moritella sp.]|uniref:ABC transporter permease n=1 Tax=Moritella sp. TaxID=78556 RepID=UPI0029BDED27|nr:FtsX-like permease family protein [Moritella sp.]MDX2319961.1 FtsX-like permease family protein [Moritella sp.]